MGGWVLKTYLALGLRPFLQCRGIGFKLLNVVRQCTEICSLDAQTLILAQTFQELKGHKPNNHASNAQQACLPYRSCHRRAKMNGMSEGKRNA